MRRAHGALLVVVALACAAAVVGVVRLWPPPEPARVDTSTVPAGVMLHKATLTAVAEVEDADDPGLAPGAEVLALTARLADGRDVSFEMVDETGDLYAVGQRVRVAEAEGPDGGVTWYVNDIERDRSLLLLTAVFLVAVLVFGRWQGLRALVGLALTLGVVVTFVVPALLAGRNPVAVALSAAVVIMAVTLYLTHGVRAKTTAAVMGTLTALALTVGLSWAFIELASLTGLSDEEARLASVSVGGLSLRGLLLAGIIIGALGVLDDVTMAQSSTVFELRRADPKAGFGRLFGGAMAVGRDHVAATINTLFLAYAGASLPLLILFSSSPDPLPVIASSEVVAVEIVRTLVGSIGLMASVPVTTALAAWLARDRDDRVLLDPADEDPPRRHRTRDELDAPSPFSGDEGELEWERRLRSSYGLRDDQRATTGDERRR
ncbi:MAG TPA: YibE/F family protein [Euzebyales bacterium]|nr:YibE/F family protein [Euzebyales bacterium]